MWGHSLSVKTAQTVALHHIEQHCRKVSADTDEEEGDLDCPRAGPPGDPSGPDKRQDGACGQACSRASALAAGWLKWLVSLS